MWAPYGGRDAVVLAVVLIVVAAALAYVGTRLRRPIHVGSPGRTAGAFMVAIWALAICTFLVAIYVYVAQMKQEHLLATPLRGRAGCAGRRSELERCPTQL